MLGVGIVTAFAVDGFAGGVAAQTGGGNGINLVCVGGVTAWIRAGGVDDGDGAGGAKGIRLELPFSSARVRGPIMLAGKIVVM